MGGSAFSALPSLASTLSLQRAEGTHPARGPCDLCCNDSSPPAGRAGHSPGQDTAAAATVLTNSGSRLESAQGCGFPTPGLTGGSKQRLRCGSAESVVHTGWGPREPSGGQERMCQGGHCAQARRGPVQMGRDSRPHGDVLREQKQWIN